MGLSNWWIARSEAADKNPKVAPSSSSTSSSSSMFKWSLKRGKSEPRKPHQSAFKLSALQTKSSASAEPQDQTEPSTSSVPSSSILTLKLRGLTAGVSQAKDLLQQYAAGVTLYPSLIHLTVPCGVSSKDSCCSPLDEPEPEAVLPSSSSSPVVDVTSDAQREFERQLDALVAKGLLDTRLTSDGCGGAYFLHDASAPDATPLGIFKPRDEEYMAPHNPRGYVKDNAVVGETEHPVNKGFRIGDGALKERAAYLLDEAYGHFSGVPVTSVVHLPVNGVVKQGSVQQFVESECSAEDMGPLKFSVPDVHKVGILDVRLFNTDRHAGNILLHKTNSSASTYEMTPIDHGFVLPSFKHLDNAQFDWLQWPQAQFPFTSDEMDHIASLDVDKDAEILKAVGIEDDAIATMKICTALLKAGADDGFSLYEIGSVLQRDGDFSQPSMLEKIVADAIRTVGDDADVDAVVDHAIRGVVALLATMQPKKKVRSISCLN